MKKTATILILGLTVFLLKTASAQEPEKQKETLSIAGEFHIGLNDFASLEEGTSKFRITPRFGYSITDLDMVYIDFTYVNFYYSRHEGYNLETSLNYRRYFKSGAFRPFVQFGIGVGYQESEDIHSEVRSYNTYGKIESGIGVSYRYKRWSFEGGMKLNYNENGVGRVQFKPMVGVSFSF